MCVKEDIVKSGHYKPKSFNLQASIPTRMPQKLREVLTHYRSVLNATGCIDFECGFVDGTCIGRWSSSSNVKQAMCCCAGCAGSQGYYHKKVLCTPQELSYYKNRYDEYLGFWRPEGGCTLRRDRRSITCLFYNCLHRIEYDTKASAAVRKAAKEKSRSLEHLRNVASYFQRHLEFMIQEQS